MNSRPIFSLLFFILAFYNSIPAQEWAPVGTRWYYTQKEFGPNTYVKIIEAVGDTLINGRACRILENVENCGVKFQFAYREERRIYYFNEVTEDFELLYDFNLEEGDTLKMYVGNNFLVNDPYDTVFIKIDSVDKLILNNDTLQVQYVSYLFDLNPEQNFGSKIYEDIGGDEFLLPTYGFCDIPTGPLRCFEHPNRGWYRFTTEFDCDQVPVREIQEKISLKIYPNPLKGRLFTVSSEVPFARIDLLNLWGQSQYSVYQTGPGNFPLDLPELPSGIYFLTFRTRDGTLYLRRLIMD